MSVDIFQLAQDNLDYAAEIRHELHRVPELAMEEFETTRIIRRELDRLDIKYQEIGLKTGCVALIQGSKPGLGSTIAIRADIDGLPMEDRSGVPYASQHPGRAHACGHDFHTACLLGTARILNGIRDHFSGTVKLIFQPAEENLHGAELMVKSGALENPHVDSMIGLHCQPTLRVGEVAIGPGNVMASSDVFTIRFTGQSAHASRPAEGVNALLAASHAVVALQEIVANEVVTREEAVINTCIFQSGSAHNIIPAEAVICGTVRCLNESVRNQLEASIRRVVRSVAEMCRCGHEITYVRGVAVLRNDPAVTELLHNAAVEAVGGEHIVPLSATMGSEDFSVYAENVKQTSYYRVGCKTSECVSQPLLHNAAFNSNDAALPYGMAVHVSYVLQRNGS